MNQLKFILQVLLKPLPVGAAHFVEPTILQGRQEPAQ
jgi:hypothetical protein